MFTRNILVIWWAGVSMVWGWQLNQDFFERVLSKPLLWLDFHEKPRVIEFFRGYIEKNISHPNGLFWPSNFRFLGNSCNFFKCCRNLEFWLFSWGLSFSPLFFQAVQKKPELIYTPRDFFNCCIKSNKWRKWNMSWAVSWTQCKCKIMPRGFGNGE